MAEKTQRNWKRSKGNSNTMVCKLIYYYWMLFLCLNYIFHQKVKVIEEFIDTQHCEKSLNILSVLDV